MAEGKAPNTPCGWLVDYLTSAGIALREIEDFAGTAIDPGDLARFSLPTGLYQRLFEWGARRLDDPLLGLHVAEALTPGNFGLLGYLLENSATLGDWLKNFTAYHPIFAQDAKVRSLTEGDRVRLEYAPVLAAGIEPRQDILLSLCVIVHAVRLATGQPFEPLQVRLTLAPPEHPETMHGALGSNLSFLEETNQIAFTLEDLKTPLPGADPVLFSILTAQAERVLETLSEHNELVHRLRMLITASLAEGGFGADLAARRLNLSVRQLHRELAERGTSFRQLRENAVHETARISLADTNIPVTEIAHRLGYSETSAFSRAFRRMEGRSPRAYRAGITRRTTV